MFGRTAALVVLISITGLSSSGCDRTTEVGGKEVRGGASEMDALLSKYTTVRLTANLGELTQNQREMIKLLIEAGKAMDDAFWIQAYGDILDDLAA